MSKSDRESPPLGGVAVAAMFWLWGALFLFGPRYVDDVGAWTAATNVAGFVCIAIGFGGGLTEAGRLWRREGLTYWGAAAVFLVPAALLHLSVEFGEPSDVIVRASRIVVLLLLAVGLPLGFYGVAHLLVTGQPEPVVDREVQRARRDDELKGWISLVVVLLTAATTIVKLVFDV